MALYYDLPVYRDTYKLILKIFEVSKDFPKEYKYTLGQELKRDALQLVRSIYRANKSTQKKERGWVEAIAETHHNGFLMRWVSRCSTHLAGVKVNLTLL